MLAAMSTYGVLAALAVVLAGCTTTKDVEPPQAPPAVEVLVPVSKPCKVEKVEKSPLATADGVPNDLFEAVKRILADRAILLGDREKMAAANSDPCPDPASKN
jgi:PBP1b-binding outer membrane lipoprotein LpoB